MRPWCMHFGREKREKGRKFSSKMQQAAANNIICSSTWPFFLKNQPTKEQKIGGKKLEKLVPSCLVYVSHTYLVYVSHTYLVYVSHAYLLHVSHTFLVHVSHRGRFGQPRTIWRRGRLQKAARTRDRCVVHMCAFVLSRRATSPAPAQRKNCRYFPT